MAVTTVVRGCLTSHMQLSVAANNNRKITNNTDNSLSALGAIKYRDVVVRMVVSSLQREGGCETPD